MSVNLTVAVRRGPCLTVLLVASYRAEPHAFVQNRPTPPAKKDKKNKKRQKRQRKGKKKPQD
jgi:hypothetical protein